MMATLIAWPALKRALGRRHALRLTRVDRNRAAKRPGDALEARFGDMMAVQAVERLDVQREAGIAGQGLEELAHELGVERADCLGREFGLEDEERPARYVQRDAGQGLVHRQKAVGVAGQAAFVAERFGERLADGDADVLDGVVIVDVAVALGANGEVDEGMTRKLIEHVIEKADAGRDVGRARSVEVEADLHACLRGLAYDRALAHGDSEVSSWLGGVIASCASFDHQNGAGTDLRPGVLQTRSLTASAALHRASGRTPV